MVALEAAIHILGRALFTALDILVDMTKLLQEAIDRLRELPDAIQDSAARALIMQLEEEPEPADLAAIAEGRRAHRRGEFISLEQWRHDMGLRNN